MELIKDREFGGERPLFESHDLRLDRETLLHNTYSISFGLDF